MKSSENNAVKLETNSFSMRSKSPISPPPAVLMVEPDYLTQSLNKVNGILNHPYHGDLSPFFQLRQELILR